LRTKSKRLDVKIKVPENKGVGTKQGLGTIVPKKKKREKKKKTKTQIKAR